MDETTYVTAGLVAREASPAAAMVWRIATPSDGMDFLSQLVLSTIIESPTEKEDAYSSAEPGEPPSQAKAAGSIGRNERQRDDFGLPTQPDWAAQALALHMMGSEITPPRFEAAAAAPEPSGGMVSDERNSVAGKSENFPLPMTNIAAPADNQDIPPPLSFDITLPARGLLDPEGTEPIAILPATSLLTKWPETSAGSALPSRSPIGTSRGPLVPHDLSPETRVMSSGHETSDPEQMMSDQTTISAVSVRPSTRPPSYDQLPSNETTASDTIATQKPSDHQGITGYDEAPDRLVHSPEPISYATPAVTDHHVRDPHLPAEAQWGGGVNSPVRTVGTGVIVHDFGPPRDRDIVFRNPMRMEEITRHDVIAVGEEPPDPRIRIRSSTSQLQIRTAPSITSRDLDDHPLVTRSATEPAWSVDRAIGAPQGSNRHDGLIAPTVVAMESLLMSGRASVQQPATGFSRPPPGGNREQGQEQQIEAETISLNPFRSDIFTPPPAAPDAGESGLTQEMMPADRILTAAPSRTAQQTFAQDSVLPPMRQLAEAMSSLHDRTSGSHRLEIALHPASLGKVQVEIIRADDMPTRVEFTVARSETLMALRHDMPALHQALDAAGIPSANREVSIQLALPVSGENTAIEMGSQFTRDEGGHNRQRYHTAVPTMSEQRWNALPDPDPIGPASTRADRYHGIDITA